VREVGGFTISPVEPTDSDLHAEFCRELAVLRLMSGPRRAALEQAVRRLREGAAVDEVIAALPVSVTEPLRGRNAPPPVATHGPPVPGTYLCPVGACPRVEQRYAGDGPPECLVHERVLTFVPDA